MNRFAIGAVAGLLVGIGVNATITRAQEPETEAQKAAGRDRMGLNLTIGEAAFSAHSLVVDGGFNSWDFRVFMLPSGERCVC